MGSGTKRVKSGSFYGTGAVVTISTVGFRAQKVELVNLASGDSLDWVEGMADDSGHKRVAGGTGSILGSNGLTISGDGFALGTDPDMNVADEKVVWTAYE